MHVTLKTLFSESCTPHHSIHPGAPREYSGTILAPLFPHSPHTLETSVNLTFKLYPPSCIVTLVLGPSPPAWSSQSCCAAAPVCCPGLSPGDCGQSSHWDLSKIGPTLISALLKCSRFFHGVCSTFPAAPTPMPPWAVTLAHCL